MADKSQETTQAIDQLLPQTQCGQCGYPACLPYARAIVDGEANINQCPPGGDTTIQALADLLNREPLPLNLSHGKHKPLHLAKIDESLCIGCVKCIRACPVDAIIGAAKQMHTVIQSHCTGCELCLPPCPVDCISMEAAPEDSLSKTARDSLASLSRQRYQKRSLRLQQLSEQKQQQAEQRHKDAREKDRAQKQQYIQEAILRSKARRGQDQ